LKCQIPLAPPLEKGDLEGFLYEVMRDTIYGNDGLVKGKLWLQISADAPDIEEVKT